MSHPEIPVRRAVSSDFLQIAELDRIAWPDQPDTFIPDGEHIWRVWVEHATVLVAELDGPTGTQICGAAVMFPTQGHELFLHKIMVDQDHRGKGLGTSLMSHMLATASKPVLLTVDPANVPACRLYEQMGFRIRKTVAGFYRPHEDRHVMEYIPEAC